MGQFLLQSSIPIDVGVLKANAGRGLYDLVLLKGNCIRKNLLTVSIHTKLLQMVKFAWKAASDPYANYTCF